MKDRRWLAENILTANEIDFYIGSVYEAVFGLLVPFIYAELSVLHEVRSEKNVRPIGRKLVITMRHLYFLCAYGAWARSRMNPAPSLMCNFYLNHIIQYQLVFGTCP